MEQVIHVTTNANTWGICATDGTLYSTRAALLAAGKTVYPGLQPMYPGSLEVSCENAGGAAGAPFYFKLNGGTAFSGLSTDAARDNVSDLNYGSGQKEVIPGLNPRLGYFNWIEEVWVRKTTGGDEVILRAIY